MTFRLHPATIPSWMLPYEVTVARVTAQAVAAGTTETADTYTKVECVKADVQPLSGPGIRMGDWGEEVRMTHIGTFLPDTDLAEGDIVKFEDGPDAGNHFRVQLLNNAHGHHLEPLLTLEVDHTSNDLIGGL